MNRTTEYNRKLVLYIPDIRWLRVTHLLPRAYTTASAVGYWEGEPEPVQVVTVFGDPEDLTRLAHAVTLALLDAGEHAVLIERELAYGAIYERERIQEEVT